MQIKTVQPRTFAIILLISSVLLGIAVTYAQVDDITIHFLNIHQDKVHQQMIEGVAGNPWQYRILADWMLEPVIKLFFNVDVPRPRTSAYIVFRFLQCLLIFLAAGVYYRKLGLPLLANLLGLSMLAWGMSHSLYNSDFSFNNFFDIAFYLIAASLILEDAFGWIPLLMIPASLNRETSALIPFLLLGLAYFENTPDRNMKRAIFFTVFSLAIFVAIFAGLRIFYGEQPFLTADGYYPGVGLLVLNVSRLVTWEEILITFGLIPLVAIFAYRDWPKTLKIFFWIVVPVWFGVHFFAALVAETRLLLVPLALVFIPGALLGIAGTADPDN
jgi:hypothetical protein